MIEFFIPGKPAPQGSHRHVGRGVLIESSKAVKPWRAAIRAAALANQIECTTGPVFVAVTFRFTRPASHYGTGRNATRVKPSAVPHPVGRGVGDLDKLLRSTLDGLTEAGAITDDAYMVSTLARKRWCHTNEVPGAYVSICPMTPDGEVDHG